jgi:dienelactone hydrolase
MRHPIDRLGGLIVARGPQRLRFFSDGWGDEAVLESMELPDSDPEPVDVTWEPSHRDQEVSIRVGRFPSPVGGLPEASRIATVTRIEPASGTERLVVLMAAWNEHDPRARLALARRLAAAGIGSLILENPYYGVRRPGGHDQPIRTVSDFALMGTGAMAEGRGLLATARGEIRTVGIAGYSMGGNLAALISATVPFPVATAPLAPSHSPAPVYLDGVLRGGIDWAALGGEATAAPRLRRILLKASVLRVAPAAHTRYAVLVAAKGDAYVPRAATQALHRHWPGSELRRVGGGHATLLWLRKADLVAAVRDSFDRLEAASPNDG